MSAISHPETSTTRTIVLLIDDNEDHRKQWSERLRNLSSHYSVLEASSAEAGLNVCRTNKVDCVLLDLDMPVSGFSALLELIPNRTRPEIAVVILTHLVHANLSEMAKHNGAQDWLVKKHTSAEELHRAIQNAVASVKSIQNAASQNGGGP